MQTATAHSHGRPKLYNPRHPERTQLYQTVAEHFEAWLELTSSGQFDGPVQTAPSGLGRTHQESQGKRGLTQPPPRQY